MPSTLMAMRRLNRPSIMIYGGTIKPEHFQGRTFDIVSAFQNEVASVEHKKAEENVLRLFEEWQRTRRTTQKNLGASERNLI
ncbi:dihydroxy-acid dehydratase, chloroplastic-like isoform X3 [Silene latifolia]|uniref:dihydroxy-acid dehydratase, chloroplastic-like isoform X3 n=1 Tax=Silene latifolia TaxID=37657 RepID=UPI003D783FBE